MGLARPFSFRNTHGREAAGRSAERDQCCGLAAVGSCATTSARAVDRELTPQSGLRRGISSAGFLASRQDLIAVESRGALGDFFRGRVIAG